MEVMVRTVHPKILNGLITVYIHLLSPRHLSVLLRQPINHCSASSAIPDRCPLVCQHLVSAISRVRLPYQLLAAGSPPSKLQSCFMDLRRVQRPSFPMETTNYTISSIIVCMLAPTTIYAVYCKSIQMRSQGKEAVCFLPCSLTVGFINHPCPYFSTS